MSDAFFEVKDLSVNFLVGKDRLNAVHNVSFKINHGETLCVVGESGCGKSVTSSAILRLLPKYTSEIVSGSILLDGKDLIKASDAEIREIRGNRISMIFQEPMTSLNPVYTIGDQMVETIRAHKKISKEEILKRWADFKGVPQELELPSAPKQFLHYYEEDNMPQTKLVRDSEKGMAVSVGRLRPDTQYDYKFICVSHNTLRGAAGGAVLVAELLCAKGYIS